jgi:outer membrane autotransporter protein
MDQQILGQPFRLGGALGYGNGALASKDNAGRNDMSSYQANLYGSYQEDGSPFFLDGSMSFAYNKYDSSRHITGAIDRIAKGRYAGWQGATMLNGGYIINMHIFDLTPMASIQYSRLGIAKYTESGADALNLTVQAQNYDVLQSGLGFRINHAIASSMGQWTPELHFKWLYDIVSDKQFLTSAFTGGGGTFRTEGADPVRSAFDVGTKMSLLTLDNLSLSLNYDLLIKKDFYSHSGFAEVGIKW